MSEPKLSRRQVLAGTAVVAGASALVAPTAAQAAPPADTSADTEAPFQLGIASGDPLPDAVVLWTRLVRDPYDAASMPSRPVPVNWQVAHDERFHHVVRAGVAFARPELAHSVHVDVRGLEPARQYFYRFRAGNAISPTGRTRTAPALWADNERLRFAVVSCQDMQNGYWPAYLNLAAEDLDVVFHVGDYIYENDPHSRFPDRNHLPPATPGIDQLLTLDDYRNRHAQYKGDPALRAAHVASAWIAAWDDHETEDNYAGLDDQQDDTGARHQTPEQFAVERAPGYQAYYEHMPIRAHLVPGSSSLRIYRRFDFGRLARVNVLDTRQYRTNQPGDLPADLGPEQFGRGNVSGTLTGAEQEQWLRDGLTGSHARWNVIAQQVMMSQTRFPNPTQVPPTIFNLDQWDGYAPQRTRLLRFLADAGIANPVVLAGDIHSTWCSDLKLNFDDPASPTVGVEFVGTSISSDFPVAFDGPIKQANPILNPHVRYFDGLKHGYLRCDVGRDVWRTDVRVVDSIEVRESPVRTAASFVVEAGHPGILPA